MLKDDSLTKNGDFAAGTIVPAPAGTVVPTLFPRDWDGFG
jgi:hypothetical protein